MRHGYCRNIAAWRFSMQPCNYISGIFKKRLKFLGHLWSCAGKATTAARSASRRRLVRSWLRHRQMRHQPNSEPGCLNVLTHIQESQGTKRAHPPRYTGARRIYANGLRSLERGVLPHDVELQFVGCQSEQNTDGNPPRVLRGGEDCISEKLKQRHQRRRGAGLDSPPSSSVRTKPERELRQDDKTAAF